MATMGALLLHLKEEDMSNIKDVSEKDIFN
jgi:hypothetical protein